jgi:hypothetical protein
MFEELEISEDSFKDIFKLLARRKKGVIEKR